VNRQTVIVVGVVLFLLLAVICLLTHAKKIENKLTAQSTETLKTAGIEGAIVSFDGRNAILNGTVASKEVLDKADGLIREVNGVRSVSNGLSVTVPLEKTVDKTVDTVVEKPAEPKVELSVDKTVETVVEKLAEPEVDLSGLLSGLIVKFATNSAHPVPEADNVLSQVVKLLTENTSQDIEIVGHADSRGLLKHNSKLSLRRALSVKHYLINHGVNAEKLRVKGYGETKPLADNSTRAGMGNNRRVEFIVVKED